MTRVRARVIVLAGPSGAGKSRLSRRIGLPVLNLDDFYKDGGDPTLPRLELGHETMVDWDDPASWDLDEAVRTIDTLCQEGHAEVPMYDLSRDGRVGTRTLDLDGAPCFVAEGVFAQEVVRDCRARGLLAEAICLRNRPVVTFWRRLCRDLRERRKHPLVLLRRGLILLRAEPEIVAHAVELGCTPLNAEDAYRRVAALLTVSG